MFVTVGDHKKQEHIRAREFDWEFTVRGPARISCARRKKHCPEKEIHLRTKRNICHFRALPERARAMKTLARKEFLGGRRPSSCGPHWPELLDSPMKCHYFGTQTTSKIRGALRAPDCMPAHGKNISVSGSLQARARAQDNTLIRI